MKNLTVLIIGLSLLFFCKTSLGNELTDNQTGVQTKTSAENTLNILSSPELNNLATSWAIEYGRLNPDMKIAVSNMTENQTTTGNNLSFITEEIGETAWKMVIGRDAIVSVVNAKNPMLNEIYRQGISAEEFARLLGNPEMQNWETMIDGGKNARINYFIISNESVKTNLANFSRTNSEAINGVMVANAAELISAVQKDVYAIGFCKLTDVRDASNNNTIEGIKLLPIDKNKNGRIDNFENIYENLSDFTRGVWIGKYPHDLCGSIYAASSAKPTDENTVAFLTWILADGQQFLNQNGYSDLASAEIQSNIDALTGTKITEAQSDEPFTSKIWLLILLGFVVTASIITAAVGYRKNRKQIAVNEDDNFAKVFNEHSVTAPKGLYFDKTHTWAFMEKNGNVKVGLDDFLQHVTGTLNRVIMREPGEMVRKGEKILTIVRDGKQLNIYSPISGIIVEQNQKLISDTSVINSSPFSKGWIYLIEPKNWLREIQFMIMGENYREWLQNEFTRLKDFFATSTRINSVAYAHITLQDGGELTDNILADLEPEVWEDFQTKFIDTSK
jgi:glycine cleavage system H lipoate-binding protein/ABC-type phosphate transport system substrate-binding protein